MAPIKKIVTSPVRTVGGFASGFRYPLKAAFYILRHPSLWPWCILPVLINIVVLVIVWHFADTYGDQLLKSYVTEAPGWYWDIVRKGASILAFLGKIVIALISFVIVGTLAAVPFNDLLSEQTDKLTGGWTDPRPFSLTRTTRELTITGLQEMKRLSMYLSLIIPLFLLSFIPLFAPFTLMLKIIVTALFFTTDYLSYPMERRGLLMFRDKFRLVRRYFFPSVGFGCAVTLLAFIPIINFLFFPLAVVGGTLLMKDLIRQYGDAMRKNLPDRFSLYTPPGTRPAATTTTQSTPPPPPKP